LRHLGISVEKKKCFNVGYKMVDAESCGCEDHRSKLKAIALGAPPSGGKEKKF